MISSDLINGAFELGGALALTANVRRLLKDRRIAGVSWVPTAFFAAWGAWNLFYYPHLGQWWSFAAGTAVVAANTTWLVLVAYFVRRR